jgi:hypothetical protein
MSAPASRAAGLGDQVVGVAELGDGVLVLGGQHEAVEPVRRRDDPDPHALVGRDDDRLAALGGGAEGALTLRMR